MRLARPALLSLLSLLSLLAACAGSSSESPASAERASAPRAAPQAAPTLPPPIRVCEDAVVSSRSSVRAPIDLFNGTDSALRIEWIDDEGQAHPYGYLSPLNDWHSESYECHVFRLSAPGEPTRFMRASASAPTWVAPAQGEAQPAPAETARALLEFLRGYRYRRLELAGFTVWQRRALDLTAADLELLEGSLEEVHAIFGPERRARIAEVPLWLERTHMHEGGAGCYHPPRRDRPAGAPTAPKRDAVELLDVGAFLGTLRHDQPMALFHEYVHALHHHADDALRQAITARYAAARDSGRYDEVGHGDRRERAYAMNSEDEYLAELSEAYFGTNDWFPYTREQILEHDPEGHALLARVWGAPPYRSGLPQTSCAGPAASRGGGSKTSILVTNRSSEPLELLRIEPTGTARPQASLAPGALTLIESWAGHLFEARRGGACVARVTAARRPGAFEILDARRSPGRPRR